MCDLEENNHVLTDYVDHEGSENDYPPPATIRRRRRAVVARRLLRNCPVAILRVLHPTVRHSSNNFNPIPLYTLPGPLALITNLSRDKAALDMT